MPQAAIVDRTAQGLPDIEQLPRRGQGSDASFDVEVKANEFWEGNPSGSDLSRRALQYQRAASSLKTEAGTRFEAGQLSAQGKQVVDNALKRDDNDSHGVYAVQIGSGDNATSRTGSLNGIAIMTEKPLGYSYLEQVVKDRLDRSGATVLYMPGRDGTLREFPSAQAAFDWIDAQLRSNPAFKQNVLARQTPEDQGKLSKVIDGDGHANADGEHVKIFARPVLGTPSRAIVDRQIDTWKTVALNDAPQGAWSSARGLDVSRSDESRILEIENSNTRLVRDRLPPGLKSLQLNPAEKQTLQGLADDNEKYRLIAKNYYGDVPDFSTYAENQIKARIRADRGVNVDPAQITVKIPVLLTTSNPMPGPSRYMTKEFEETYPLTELVAQQYLNTAPWNWVLSHVTFSGPGADKLDRTYVQTLSDTLDLEKNYTKLVHKALDRPANPEDAAAFDIAQAAAKKANTSTMTLDALIARRSGALSDHDYQMMQEVIDHPDGTRRPAGADGKTTRAYGLVLNGTTGREGVSLRDVTAFAREGEKHIVVYTPNAPDGKTFRAYSGRLAFMADLRQQIASIKNADPGKWSPMAQYWASQFGAHQLKDSLPWLRQVANGKGGSELSQVRIDKDFFQNQYDYRTRHLLADADASAMTDSEVTRENAITYLNLAYQLAKFFAPNFITLPLALSEIAMSLFQGYQAYNLGDKEAASHAVIDALSNAASVPFDLVGGSGLKGFRTRQPIVAISAKKLVLDAPASYSSDAAGFVPLPSGSRFDGMYAKEGKLYAKLGGKYKEAYFDKVSNAVRVGNPRSPMAGTWADTSPQIQRDPVSGNWRAVPGLGLKGGSPDSFAQQFKTKLPQTPDSSAQKFDGIMNPADGDQLGAIGGRANFPKVTWYDSNAKYQITSSDKATHTPHGFYSEQFLTDLVRNDYHVLLGEFPRAREAGLIDTHGYQGFNMKLNKDPADPTSPQAKLRELERVIPDPNLRAKMSEVAHQGFMFDPVFGILQRLKGELQFRSDNTEFYLYYNPNSKDTAKVLVESRASIMDPETSAKVPGVSVQIQRSIDLHKDARSGWELIPSAPIRYEVRVS